MDKLTVESVKNFDSDVDYTTFLENFEGPLDLLLYLIKQEEIEIKDIFVSQVTDQFLDYMRGLPYLDIEKASEYLYIAATIIDIKARSLVPPTNDGFDDDFYEEDDAERDFISILEEYDLIKQETTKLKERETIGYYFKSPDQDVKNVNVQYKDLTLDGLVKAFADLMLKRESEKSQKATIKEIPKDRFTVAQKINHIRDMVKERGIVQFEELFDETASKPEIVTTFQALLELLKHQFIIVHQDDLFSPIQITKNMNKNEDEEIGKIDEYN